MSVCVKRDHNASAAQAKLSQVRSIVILFIFFLKLISYGRYKLEGTRKERKSRCIFLFSLLLAGTCSATGAASADSLSKAEPQREFRTLSLYENQAFSLKAKN